MKDKISIAAVIILAAAILSFARAVATHARRQPAPHERMSPATSGVFKSPQSGSGQSADSPGNSPAAARFPALELLGTLIFSPKDRAAYIRDIQAGTQGTYRIGAVIRGAAITSIEKGKVEITFAGVRTILSVGGIASLRTAGLNEAVIASAHGNEVTISRRGLISKTDALVAAFSAVSLTPCGAGDGMNGMIIGDIPDDSIFAAAGLRNNDIVTMINNQPVNSYQKALQIALKAGRAAEIRVTILRAGRAAQLCYKFAP